MHSRAEWCTNQLERVDGMMAKLVPLICLRKLDFVIEINVFFVMDQHDLWCVCVCRNGNTFDFDIRWTYFTNDPTCQSSSWWWNYCFILFNHQSWRWKTKSWMMKLLMMNKNHDDMSIQLIRFCTCHEKKPVKLISVGKKKHRNLRLASPGAPFGNLVFGLSFVLWLGGWNLGLNRLCNFRFFFVSGVSTSWII